MKWFKHYSNTMESDSIMELKRKFGFEGLGRYWVFIEYLNKLWVDSNDPPIFDIQREAMRNLFGIRSWNGLETFLDHLGTIPGMVVERSGNGPGMVAERSPNVYRIKAPILLKLLHSDFKKSGVNQEQIPAKIESKKEKENKIKKKTPPNPQIEKNLKLVGEQLECIKIKNLHDLVFSSYNNFTFGKLPKARFLNPKRKKIIKKLTEEFDGLKNIEDFDAYFQKAASLPFLCGASESGWRADFEWLLNPNNALKVAEGRYDKLGTKTKSKGEKQDDRYKDMYDQIERGEDE